ncbi:TRAP transporter small permease [Patescibacteria group bacterium]|nr:TRAP transporter small permease [Patescibacteria group bacterium]
MKAFHAYFKAAVRVIDQRLEEIICMFAVSLMASCTFLQLSVRSIFGKSFAWPEELAVYGMAWAMYMGAAMCVRGRGHIRIMIAVNAFPEHMATFFVVLGDILWMAFNIFMVWHGYKYIELLWNQVFISPALHIDQKWPQMIVPLGYALMSVRMVQCYYSWYKGGFKGYPT